MNIASERNRGAVDGHPAGEVRAVDASVTSEVRETVRQGELTISLLPVSFHVRVAEACVAEKKHFVTTSYVSEEMRWLHGEAKRAKVLLLNEIGADPGIDHMQAMRLIHRVRRRGGRVTGFRSLCGGVPAPDSNDNPWGYKLSWSPRGVLLSQQAARDKGLRIAIDADTGGRTGVRDKALTGVDIGIGCGAGINRYADAFQVARIEVGCTGYIR